jgi:hypothetical protein
LFFREEFGKHEGFRMVELPKFKVGELVVSSNSLTSGLIDGQVGLVVKVEMITRDHYIYWVRFSKKENDSPMWDTEIKLLDERDTRNR